MDTKTKQAQLKADSRIARCLSLPFLVETCANSMRQLPRCEHATHCGFHTVHTVFSQLLDETRGFWLPSYQHGHVPGLKTERSLLQVLKLAFRVVGPHRVTGPMKALVAKSWPWLLLLALLLPLLFAPLSWLHGMTHRWAMAA